MNMWKGKLEVRTEERDREEREGEGEKKDV